MTTPFTHYRIVDSHTGKVISTAPYSRRQQLRDKADRMDNAYGACRYRAEPFNA